MKRLLLSILIVPALLIGCGDDPPPVKSGRVIDKHYEPLREWDTSTPQYISSCSTTGNPPVTSCNQIYVGEDVQHHVDDEDYKLRLSDCKGEGEERSCREGTIEVDKGVYEHTPVGSYYRDPSEEPR